MKWSRFTTLNINLFNNFKITKNNILLLNLESEKENILNKFKSIQVIIKPYKFNDKIKDLINGSFVYKDGIIMNLDKKPDEYIIEWDGNYIYIKTTEAFMINFKKRIKVLINMIEYIKSKNNNISKKIRIYLILLDLEKNLPNNNEIIKAKHANTGYTDHSKNIIFIWRHEEFEKVLLHEVIHFFELDCSDDIIKINKIIINGPSERYYEALTDYYAICYHLIYISILTNIKLKGLLEIELAFMKNQANVLNKYYNLKNWTINNNIIINQDTSAFSYYIVKYLLFEYMLYNNTNIMNNYYEILNIILNKGFKTSKFINVKSLRMTLLQIY